VDVDNWVTLFGLNEKYLNSLVARFDEGLIKDFYSYFREPWAMAVFHDRFGDFHVELKELLASKTVSISRMMHYKLCKKPVLLLSRVRMHRHWKKELVAC
jgi:hypothetical protein